jgi:integrase
MPKKPKRWSFAAGEKGTTVTVYEREPGGLLYARAFDPARAGGKGGYVCRSLKHRDQERATTYALAQTAKLRQGRNELAEGKVTLARVFALYDANRTPRKSKSEQEADKRRVKLWSCFLGSHKDPHVITRGEWERFIDLRSSGAISGLGSPVSDDERRSVRDRTVQHDCLWLRWVLNWATTWQTPEGRYLMRENPVRGFETPVEKNPRRPVATTDRYEALRAVSDRVTMELRWGGKARKQRSYLAELLDIAFGTGRRISAICALRYEDLRLDTKPHGAIRWPAATDKQGRETTAPVSPKVRAALDTIQRERPGIGAAYLFPCPTNPNEPVAYERVRTWLLEAEGLANVPKQDGSLWHAFRRAWATARKSHSVKDVAEAGGWASTETLVRCYQQPDPETMLRVVLEGAELREKKAL